MRIELGKKKEKYKVILIAILLAASCFMTYYFHEVVKSGAVFTHFFYIPIILASLWWKTKGVLVAIFLATLLIISDLFLTDYMTTVNDSFRAIMFVGIALLVAELSKKIAKSREKTAHLNAVLYAIRNVGQLLAKEKARGRLLKAVCDNLISTLGYYSVWIALFNQTGGLWKTTEAGLGKDFLQMDERLKHGELSGYCRKALSQPGIVITKDPLATCVDCPLSGRYGDRGGMTVRLEYQEKIYGLICASIPADFDEDGEEQTLFKDMAFDIAFALRNIEIKEAHERADEELREYRERLEKMVEEQTTELKTIIDRLKNEVAERKLAEAEVARAASYTRNLIEASLDPLVTIAPDGKISDVNKATEKATGIKKKEMIGTDYCDYFTEPSKARDGYKQVFKKGIVKDYGLEIKHRNGSVTPVLYNASVFKDESKQVAGVFAAARDIAEQKRLQTQLQQAQKMEAIGTLAGGIAHDFNNILGAIIGYTEISLYHEIPEGNPARNSMAQVLKAGLRAKNLVQQILTFSRQKEQEIKYIKITSIVKEVIKLLRATLPTTIEISRKITAKSDIILGEPTQIHQVMMNLCTNAGHAMRRNGGILEITLENIPIADSPLAIVESEKAKIALDSGLCLKLSVSDTGHGMERSVLERIYEPYYTTKTMKEGTGFGLAVIHGIVKSLGGKMDVKSEPGKGSVFNIFIPVAEVEVESEIEATGPVSTGNEHILFVDDEEALLDVEKHLLETQGYKVTTKSSAIEALDTFRTQPGEFDLVITDMTMPNMTGDELARELMKIRPDVPIILCTGFSEFITEEMARSMGIRCFIMKPFVTHKIARTIRRVLNG